MTTDSSSSCMKQIYSHTETKDEHPTNIVFDSSILQHQINIPSQFIWPKHEQPCLEPPPPPLSVPPIDLNAFLSGDPLAVSRAISLVNEACKKHGFFLVVNHGIDHNLISEAQKNMDLFFEQSLALKLKAQRKPGDLFGYANSFTNRFSCRLPWKETFSFRYCPDHQQPNIVEGYITNVLGEEFRQFGKVYQKYCEAMDYLSLNILELLGMSLGVGHKYFREFFQEQDSIMRLNYYPPCKKPDQTLGTGPHCDAVSLTILYQDGNVRGLEVQVDGKWHSIPPKSNAFVVNIGDTFVAISNGIYKSCLHRAVVNSQNPRKSMAFFLSPSMEKVIKPPQELISIGNKKQRIYPDFKWKSLLNFTQTCYRADMNTLDAFINWIGGNKEQSHEENLLD